MTSGFEHFFWQQRELERILKCMRPMENVWRSIPESFIDNFTKLDLLRDQFTLPTDYLTSTSKIMERLAQKPTVKSLQLINSIHSPAVEMLRREHTKIAALAKSMTTAVFDTQAVLKPMLDSLASTEALLSIDRLNKQWVDIALQPQLAFQEFVKKHISFAANASEVARQNRLGLLDSSANLLESITRGFDLAALMRPTTEELWIGPTFEVNVFHTLDDEIKVLDFDQTINDIDSVVEETQSGKVTELGARLVKLVYNLNVEAEREGKIPVFKPTTKALMACVVIPSCVAEDSTSFAEVIDHLFFLLYEGSGSAKRLTAIYDDSQLSALWMLKHLRLGARHDIDHGTEQDVEKKNRQVGEAYMALVGKVIPRDKVDWMTAQLALYKELCDMLEIIWLGEE